MAVHEAWVWYRHFFSLGVAITFKILRLVDLLLGLESWNWIVAYLRMRGMSLMSDGEGDVGH